ncbi:MAG TPA: heme exporter protein CcmB [Casimicrobiaceae bacterium]|nr:heme exporter protein CcmB [Casimicrobiaceae bacterium]
MSSTSPLHTDVAAGATSTPPASPPLRDDVLAGLRWALARDLRLAFRSRAELGVQLAFYLLVIALFPLATTPERALLVAMGPAVLWVAALLASLLSLQRLFAADHADGTLEQIALSPMPLQAIVSGKILAHWLTTGLPVVVLVPLTGLAYQLDTQSLAVLIAGLLIGTPILSLLGAIGAALTLGARGGGGLLALLVLPLYVPVLIFGAAAVDAARSGLGAGANLSLLGAGLAVALAAAPFAAASAVRIALD